MRTALTYLLVAGEFQDDEEFLKTIEIGLSPETGDAIMSVAQRLEAKGIAKGRMEGHAEGHAVGRIQGQIETKKNVAQKLLKQGHSVEFISQVIDLTREEIEELAE